MDFLNILSIILGIIASAIAIITGFVAFMKIAKNFYNQPQQKNTSLIYIPESIKKQDKSNIKRIWVPTVFAFIIILSSIVGISLFRFASDNIIHTHATRTAQSTATVSNNTPQALYNRITSSSPVLDDPLTKNGTNKWQEYTDPGGFGCIFTGGSYYIYLQSYANLDCIAVYTNFSNFAYQVQMTIIRGESGGLSSASLILTTRSFITSTLAPMEHTLSPSLAMYTMRMTCYYEAGLLHLSSVA